MLELLGIQDSRLALLVHVTVFMGVSFSIARSPSRLADRVGRWLTPALLALLALLCGVHHRDVPQGGARGHRALRE